jgi:hypothetical protein
MARAEGVQYCGVELAAVVVPEAERSPPHDRSRPLEDDLFIQPVPCTFNP